MCVLESSFPTFTIAKSTDDIFVNINDGAVAEAFDTQELPAIKFGVVDYWYPQYIATVVIAVDHDQTDVQING